MISCEFCKQKFRLNQRYQDHLNKKHSLDILKNATKDIELVENLLSMKDDIELVENIDLNNIKPEFVPDNTQEDITKLSSEIKDLKERFEALLEKLPLCELAPGCFIPM